MVEGRLSRPEPRWAFPERHAIIASVQVRIGPVQSEAALAWLNYARSVVEAMSRQLPIQVAASFAGYLEEWIGAAHGETFVWEGRAEPEEVEYLLHAWFNLARAVAEQRERTGEPIRPVEGEVFYKALVNALLDALRSENRATAEFVEQLAPFWPGLA
ncbi:MAG: hypothetical protein QOK43_348 [Acidimicrobiaceae bacterium]|nr:hypothetical protein [Acidimicrobiaceae bacterium]